MHREEGVAQTGRKITTGAGGGANGERKEWGRVGGMDDQISANILQVLPSVLVRR